MEAGRPVGWNGVVGVALSAGSYFPTIYADILLNLFTARRERKFAEKSLCGESSCVGGQARSASDFHPPFSGSRVAGEAKRQRF